MTYAMIHWIAACKCLGNKKVTYHRKNQKQKTKNKKRTIKYIPAPRTGAKIRRLDSSDNANILTGPLMAGIMDFILPNCLLVTTTGANDLAGTNLGYQVSHLEWFVGLWSSFYTWKCWTTGRFNKLFQEVIQGGHIFLNIVTKQCQVVGTCCLWGYPESVL